MKRFVAPALVPALMLSLALGLAAQTSDTDPRYQDVSPGRPANDASGDFDYTDAPVGGVDFPGYDDIGIRPTGRDDRPQDGDRQAARPSAPATRNPEQLRMLEDELIRIELELRDLESDIRTYRGLLQTARDRGEAQELEGAIRAYEAQRQALQTQRTELRRLKQQGGWTSERDGQLDPDYTSRVYDRAREDRIRDGELNPLSPESLTADQIDDIFKARDVTENKAIQDFIEKIKDDELRTQTQNVFDMAQGEPTLQQPLRDLLKAIAEAGERATLENEAIRQALDHAKEEVTRRGVSSNDLLQRLISMNPTADMALADYKDRVAALIKVDADLAPLLESGRKLRGDVAGAMKAFKDDYVAYQAAEKAFTESRQSDDGKWKATESAFQKHVLSMNALWQLIARYTGDSNGPDNLLEPAGARPEAPELVTRRDTQEEPPVPEIESTPRTATETQSEPRAATTSVREEEPPSEAERSNPEGLAKVSEALKTFNEKVDWKVKAIRIQMKRAWEADDAWHAGIFSDTSRVKELREIASKDFAWSGDKNQRNVFLYWPDLLESAFAEGRTRGIDVTAEPSLRQAWEKARDALVASMLIARELKSYNGHHTRIQDAEVNESARLLHMNFVPENPTFWLQDVRAEVLNDVPLAREKIDGLWDYESLKRHKDLLAAKLRGEEIRDESSQLVDVKVKWKQYMSKLRQGYTVTYGGVWMDLRSNLAYKLAELISHYLEKGDYFEAKLVMDLIP